VGGGDCVVGGGGGRVGVWRGGRWLHGR
jgi:hypothetical protein